MKRSLRFREYTVGGPLCETLCLSCFFCFRARVKQQRRDGYGSSLVSKGVFFAVKTGKELVNSLFRHMIS